MAEVDYEGIELHERLRAALALIAQQKAEIERLRLLIHAYAAAADGIVLNWNQDRFGNWAAFDVAHHAILDEARRG